MALQKEGKENIYKVKSYSDVWFDRDMISWPNVNLNLVDTFAVLMNFLFIKSTKIRVFVVHYLNCVHTNLRFIFENENKDSIFFF